jgi:cobalt/nickel transport protein
MRRLPTRVVLGGLLLAAVLMAGVVSFYASSHPDGLERVAEDEGFLSSAEDHATGDGPFADYATEGVDDARLSGGLAGVLGAGVVLLVMGGVAFAVRRRSGPAETGSESAESGTHAASGTGVS